MKEFERDTALEIQAWKAQEAEAKAERKAEKARLRERAIQAVNLGKAAEKCEEFEPFQKYLESLRRELQEAHTKTLDPGLTREQRGDLCLVCQGFQEALAWGDTLRARAEAARCSLSAMDKDKEEKEEEG